MRMIKLSVLILISAAIGGSIVWASSGILNVGTPSITTSYFASNIAGNTSFACRALIATSIHGNAAISEVEGEVTPGTDSIALKIVDSDTVQLNTAANVAAGIAEGDNMRILGNDEKKLMAVWYSDQGNSVISTIALNKENGLAVWTKANSEFLLLGTPYGTAIYMQCL